MKRFLSALLAICCLLPLATGCADSGKGDTGSDTARNDATAAVAETEVVTENPYDENGYLRDSVPSTLRYDGTALRTLRWTENIFEEFEVKEQTGDVVNDALWARNLKVSERLGITFDYTESVGQNDSCTTYIKVITASYDSGEPFDIYASYSMTTPMVATYGYAQNLLSYDVIDFSAPWWPDALLEQATIKDKLYFCSGDISMNLLYMMYAVYFNKELLTDFKLESPYDLVEANNWTFDKLFEMCASADVAATSETDKTYAFTIVSSVHVDPFFYAAGLKTIEQDADGNLVISDSFSNERCVDVFTAVGEFLTKPYNSVTNGDTLFAQNSALFLMHRTQYSAQSLPNVTFEYGVAPVPKYNSDQEVYRTCTGFPYTMYAIAEGSKNGNAAAAALEVLASESYRTVTPAVYEVTMKTRYAQESSAGKMYDIIKEGITFDLGRLYARNLDTLTYSLIRPPMANNTAKTYLSTFKASQKRLQSGLDKINASFAG